MGKKDELDGFTSKDVDRLKKGERQADNGINWGFFTYGDRPFVIVVMLVIIALGLVFVVASIRVTNAQSTLSEIEALREQTLQLERELQQMEVAIKSRYGEEVTGWPPESLAAYRALVSKFAEAAVNYNVKCAAFNAAQSRHLQKDAFGFEPRCSSLGSSSFLVE